MKPFNRYAVLLLLLLALAISACGGAANSSDAGDEGTTARATATTETMEPTAETMEPTEEAAPTEEVTATEEPAGGDMGEGMMLPEVDVLALPADPIIAAGSSTVFPLAEAMAERFNDEGFEGEITIDSVGTGGGFERFCVAADSDIANASRPINDEERAACQASDREPIEFRVGTDALAVVVSSENDFVDELSLEQLAQIFSGEAQTWDQVDAAFPAEEIQLFSPGSDSGTFDYFVEAVLDDDNTGILAASNIQLSEDDNVLVQGVEGSPYAIGYFGYAYYLENEDRLKILTIDGVEPTAESAESNEYPLSRPLYLYSDAATLANKPQVAAFINFFLSFVNEEIEEVGYFPASPEALDEAKQSFLDAAGE